MVVREGARRRRGRWDLRAQQSGLAALDHAMAARVPAELPEEWQELLKGR